MQIKLEKVALVSGASRGIGAAILLALAKAGAIVIGTATTQNGAEAISQKLKAVGLNGSGMVLDVNDHTQINQVLATIKSRFGIINILVNNAGVTDDNLLIRMQDKQWQNVINTNLNSVYHLSRGVLRDMMKKRSGRIISIASVVGSMGNSGQTNYAASKAGIIGFSKSLAREVANRGITVNSIAPGFIETDMTNALSLKNQQALKAQIPMARFGSAEDIANCVLFLASDYASYISAQTIHINGAMYAV